MLSPTAKEAAPKPGDFFDDGGAGSGRTSRLLHEPDDHFFLNESFCFVRRHVEAFVVAAPDEEGFGVIADASMRNRRPGQVGLRCAHCSRRPQQTPPKGAVSFPMSIRLVYQGVRNMQRYHLQECPSMPPEARAEYDTLRGGRRSRSGKDAPRYWEECCRRMGMVDSEDGTCIQLRSGCFEGVGNGCGSLDFIRDVPPGSLASMKLSIVAAGGTRACAPALWAGGNASEASNCIGVGPAQALSVGSNGAAFDASTNKFAVATSAQGGNGSSTRQSDVPADNSGTGAFAIAAGAQPLQANSSLFDGNNGGAKLSSDIDSSPHDSSTFCSSVQQCPAAAAMPQAALQIAQASSLSETNCSAAIGPSIDPVLGKVRLALSIVDAVGQIQQLPPTKEATDENKPYQAGNLSYIGAVLYELFSGQNPYDNRDDCNGSSESDGFSSSAAGLALSDESRRRRQKKEKRPSSPGYVRLSDFGLPPVICRLVSSLLDSDGNSACNNYTSICEVKDDLGLMVSEPEKYLFRVANGHFQIDPSALYGRERETAKLLEALDHVTDPFGMRTREMVLLSGYSGTGKSSIVEKARDHLIEKGACFVSGKYDAMRQLQPLSAMVSAIDDYCGLLANDSVRIDGVREAVGSGVLGSEGLAVLSSLIPNFRKVVESSDDNVPATQVNGREALQRIISMICMLFRATCSACCPVCLFLDDLQWADEVSLLLMEALVSDSMIEGLLFIGCYRDNEVGADHPLSKHLADIRRSGTTHIESLCIGNLDLEGVNSLLSDTLSLTPRMAQSLAKAVLHKTAGNALFVVQFLASLCDEGLLTFSLSSRRWEWDIGKIRDKNIADNVVGLMTAKLLKMAPEVLEALRVAAAFGAQCQEDLLTILDKAPGRVRSTAAALEVAVAEGIMNKVGSAYRFTHDQIQQAAYLLIPGSEREAFHLQIGRLLWKFSSADEAETYIFCIVDQLHRGCSLITDHDEKVALAQLSLMAGEMASAMSAFLPASAYLNAGVELLVNEDWHYHRHLCFDLNNSSAEIEYILGNFDSMQIRLDEVMSKGRTLQEKLRAYHTLVQSLGARGRTTAAINTAFSVLDQLGETLPAESSVKQEIEMTQVLLSTENEDSLMHLKTMEDAEKRDAMMLLSTVIYYVFTEKGPKYFSILVCRMVRLSLLYGVCKESAVGFASYGIIQCRLSNASEGYRYGKLALNIMDRFQAKEHLAKIFLAVYGVVNHFTEPIQSCMPPIKLALEVGLATGDTENAMLCAHSYNAVAFASGKTLGPLVEEMKLHSKQMVECKQIRTEMISKPCHQAALNLLGRSADPIKLVGEEMDENSILDSFEDSNQVLFLIQSYRMWLEYMFGEYHLAWQTGESNKEIGEVKRALMSLLCHNVFFLCLTAIALARKEGEREYATTIDKTMAQMEEWTVTAPWNCQNKLELMKAEHAYLKGDTVSAATHYKLAADLAGKHRFTHEKALALERFGLYHMEMGAHATASNLFTEARECYLQWGALSKVAHIEEQYL